MSNYDADIKRYLKLHPEMTGRLANEIAMQMLLDAIRNTTWVDPEYEEKIIDKLSSIGEECYG